MAKENRAAARLNAVQALYQMDVAAKGLHEITAEFEAHWIGREIEGDTYIEADLDLFRTILKGVLDHQRVLDVMIDDALAKGWPLKRVEAVLRALLRAGTFELRHLKDVPARVAIKEYVDVAAAFLDRDEVGMANAVLDALARQLRSNEFDAPR